ncbi:cbb3-type cytochrome c oxidase N-terminal domain-containing protein [Sphingobacterium bambusae]|uniref:Cbb3-type cytochrome c oxidase N-terminal domain-containing protein n=1 Tax=Sphingobacterium bambusae TaxID=662858 RepID=A0ABW6BMR5_9SPHI|nr:cbb3-type cytochrome c oxidase N-terminal domain-containing protein [Sphingobacterium bambusae]WPL50000.1 cbb3-type cytochrome c oxidase N-terminal domain-containing protein [Sphingobacterium bambusae]
MNTVLLAVDSTAKAAEWYMGSGNIYNDVLIIALIVVMLVLLSSSIVVHRAFKAIIKLTMPELAAEEEAKRTKKTDWQAVWNRLLSLRPLAEEKDLEIDHEYDGIKELDNPIPAWFNALFYSTMTFGLVYLMVYHVFGWGLSQEQEYNREVVLAEKAKQEYLAQAANLIDETSITVDESGAMAASGKAVFMANCVACHGNAGEGGIGPNLTDEYWLHGADIKDIFKIVKYGVAAKGMVPWEQTLTPAQIAEVSNYIYSLRGTNPANAKEPQGEKVSVDETAVADTLSTVD